MTHYNTFRDQLAIAHPAFGVALWEPDPGELYPPVEVGDVGFVRQGKFHRLFNTLLPANHQSHQRFGVPERYEPLRLSVPNHIDHGTLYPNNFCSYGVTVESGGSDVFAVAPPSSDSEEVSFSCTRKHGAALSLPVVARREDTLSQAHFGTWITRHIDSWFAFSQRHGLGIEMEDIVLVTGCHRTRSWSNIAFHESQADSRISLRVQVPGIGTTVRWQVLSQRMQGAVMSHGPSGENLPENQCLFIRGFRVKRLFWIIPRLKGAAGPQPDPGGDDHEPEMELISIPSVTECRDPLHVLLDYIATRAPDCDMALVHDDDLERILGVGGGTSLETLEPDVVMNYLQRSRPEIGVMSDLGTANNESQRSDTKRMTVAMLSEQLHSLHPPASVPLPSHSLGGMTDTKEVTDYDTPSNQPRLAPPPPLHSEPMEHLHRALERLRAESSRNLRVSASDSVITESETSIDDTVNAVERSRTPSVGWSGVGKSESSPIDRVSGTNLKKTSVAYDKLKESDDPYADLASFSFGKDKTRRVRSERRAIDDGGRRPPHPINRYTLGRPNANDFGGPLSRSNPETSGSDSEPIQKKSTHTMSTSGSGSETPSRTLKYPERTKLPPKLPVTDRFSKRKKVATPSNQTQRRPTPIRNLANAPKTTGEMMWNPQTLRWEGNDRAGGTPSIYSDPGNESGVVDTDVELEDIAPEDASLYTLGEPRVDWYIVDPNEGRQEAGSPVTFANVGSDDDDESNVSESGSRGLASIRRSSKAIPRTSTRDRSFHAGDSDFVPTQSNARQREDSTTTVRRPSYNDTEGGASVTVTGSNRDQPPLLPADRSTFNVGISPPVHSVEDVFRGIDFLNFGGPEGLDTLRSSPSFVAPQSSSLPRSKDEREPKREKNKEQGKGEDLDADVTLDDWFLGSHPWDNPDYKLRRDEWSFIRERERVSLPPLEPDGNPRLWDVWRCSQIGQIRVERATLPPSNPNKPNQQRLNAEHDVDPDSANTLGGPTTVVHRHSRAPAFSIYRHYNPRDYHSGETHDSTATVSTRTARSSKTRTAVMSTHDGIFLATKRVQERFTITEGTAKLATYGLLPEEGDNRRDTRRATKDWSESSPVLELPHHMVDLSKLKELDSQTSSVRGAKSLHISESSLDLSSIKASAPSTPTSRSASPPAPFMPSPERSTASLKRINLHDEAEEDSDNESVNPVSRTSHAEAFATLDTRAINQLKNEQVPVLATKRSRGWIQRFIGSPSDKTPPRTLSSSLAPTSPPWMTLAPRSMHEEQDRGLKSSFKAVGLVPSIRSKGGAGINHEGKGKNRGVLTQVPDESLYMLLPLWPHETDPASAVPKQRQRTPKIMDKERSLYLLVYYIPFDRRHEDNLTKKRSRFRLRKGERKHPTPLLDVRRGFKVIGQLVTHSDLNGSGIRLPVRGLSVTGPLEEAELAIPPVSLRDVHPDSFVIGACMDGRGTTIEFFPEGLEKLGLCVPRTEPVQFDLDSAEPVVEQPLNAIGRAVVEVAWLGCMALMTFDGPQSQSSA